MNGCARITQGLIVSHNICVRGLQLWLYWQGLKSLWSFGLEGWVLGFIFAMAYFMIGNFIEGFMIPLPPALEAPSRTRDRCGSGRIN